MGVYTSDWGGGDLKHTSCDRKDALASLTVCVGGGAGLRWLGRWVCAPQG